MEERVKQLETITKRLMRRSQKHIVGLVTPYPISNAVFGEDVKGPILYYMFPCDGTITKAMLSLSAKPQKYITINIKIFNGQQIALKGFNVESRVLTVEPNLTVKSGDCLEVSLVPPEGEVIKEAWISFLWSPAMKDVTAKSFLISELENDLLEGKALITE